MARSKVDEWLTADGLTKLEGWARDGLTDQQIAHNMGCAYSTLRVWKDKHETISASLKKGKEVVDILVENALLKRALGYDYEEKIVEQNADGSQRKKIIKKHMPPETLAQIYWLKNRRPDKWRDKPVTSADTSEIEDLTPLAEMLKK